jgi:hypothetical protein
LCGALLNRGLHSRLDGVPGTSAKLNPAELLRSPSETTKLPARVVVHIHAAFADSLHTVFVDLIPFAVLILVGTSLLKELALRKDAIVAPAETVPPSGVEPATQLPES